MATKDPTVVAYQPQVLAGTERADVARPLRRLRVTIDETRTATAIVAVPVEFEEFHVEEYLSRLGTGEGNDGPSLADLVDDAQYNADYEVTDRGWDWTEDGPEEARDGLRR